MQVSTTANTVTTTQTAGHPRLEQDREGLQEQVARLQTPARRRPNGQDHGEDLVIQMRPVVVGKLEGV